MFFISGIWIERYPENYKKIFDEGHEIGNHSYKHPHMLELSEKEVIQEIMKAEELSKNVIETGCRLFRFPYGESNEKLTQLLQEKGVVSIKWTIDSMDWKGIRPEEIFDNVVRNDDLGNGAIILMHNSGEHTAEALD